jgi:hypothetical protein
MHRGDVVDDAHEGVVDLAVTRHTGVGAAVGAGEVAGVGQLDLEGRGGGLGYLPAAISTTRRAAS